MNQNYDMISHLFPETNGFTIKVTVIKKADIREYKSKKGDPGKVFSIDVMDKNNSEIQVTFFNELVDKFFHILQEQKIYTISGGRIQNSNSRF